MFGGGLPIASRPPTLLHDNSFRRFYGTCVPVITSDDPDSNFSLQQACHKFVMTRVQVHHKFVMTRVQACSKLTKASKSP
ncbi:hypothetical protein AVEN_95030-1 [Araneus ventricosus]|uniref:Uncharacterized protein n=1 Tax=Araneus ventricosus TaxID=182803 RepID=A0A4Y2CJH7_ARAVE|nr:hypothetical protein AVEN_99463-1 [Araneus ventricosus]GBM04354.1 hypothetical protein AVEN_95030-1 [Araneus ventricosus]